MKKPKFPKSKTLASLKKYEQKLKEYKTAKALEEKLRRDSWKV